MVSVVMNVDMIAPLLWQFATQGKIPFTQSWFIMFHAQWHTQFCSFIKSDDSKVKQINMKFIT